MLMCREKMFVIVKYAKICSKQQDWAYWAPQGPVAVRDSPQEGALRYAMDGWQFESRNSSRYAETFRDPCREAFEADSSSSWCI
ncbi:hypothetical protein E3N88_02672 [Mikania micrantha]|uniref:Uncharacterized protein n=1 Tax=Mikania micrantha TaxID=192012 RepID=A0A5N6Q675_9ASTR|nr:hypothetical protein E3N88_02672 [Mikania micrantha]